jgi:hypothetical protein
MPKQIQLASCLPVGSKYVIESRRMNKNCMVMHRYVELPDGRRVEFAPRVLPRKQHGKKIGVSKERQHAKVVNLMETLRQSIAAESVGKSKPAARSAHRVSAEKKLDRSNARQRRAS